MVSKYNSMGAQTNISFGEVGSNLLAFTSHQLSPPLFGECRMDHLALCLRSKGINPT